MKGYGHVICFFNNFLLSFILYLCSNVNNVSDISGQLYEKKGLSKEAFGAYTKALDVEPAHVPSLVSTAIVLRQLGDRPLSTVRCFLTRALQLDRTNHAAWFNLGLLYEAEGARSAREAAECFQAAALLEETAPVEPFR